MRIPFFAIKNIRADGSGWKPGASVKWAARTKAEDISRFKTHGWTERAERLCVHRSLRHGTTRLAGKKRNGITGYKQLPGTAFAIVVASSSYPKARIWECAGRRSR